MGHGFQMLPEFKPKTVREGILIESGSTKYLTLTDASHWDSVYGIWLFIVAHTTGGRNVTVTLQGAVDPNQGTWTDLDGGTTITGGTLTSPKEPQIMDAPLVVAAGSPIKTFPPFLRLKMVTDGGTVAAIHSVTRSIRGLT